MLRCGHLGGAYIGCSRSEHIASVSPEDNSCAAAIFRLASNRPLNDRRATAGRNRKGALMFIHKKELPRPVEVNKPDTKLGQFLLVQFGGATGELTAALQYWVQSFHTEDGGIRDM